jgi:hypothetical protein
MGSRQRLCPGCRSFRDPHNLGPTCTLLDGAREEAKRLLEEGAKEARDFCALYKKQLDDMKHLPFFIELFANWLYQGGSDK